MEIGAKVTFKAKELYVNSYEAEYVRGELIFKYKLCRKKGIWQEKLFNEKLNGISLEGKVMEVSGEQVKLHLNIDEAQNQSKAAWFRYAPPTGNLMYSMPIVGTNANLYFPSERSQDPMVIGCVRKNGGSCEKFSNVNNRYFSTESGNNLDMLPDSINFSRPGLSATFNDGGGINLSSSSTLSLNAGYVGVFAGDISIQGQSKVVAEKGSSFISLENDFYNDAGIVMENGSDRASNEKFTDDEPTSGVTEAKAAMEAQMNLAALSDASQGANPVVGDITSSNDPLNLYSNKPWMNDLNEMSSDNGCYIKPTNNDSRPVNKWDECKEAVKNAWDYGKSALNAIADVGTNIYFSAFQAIPKIGRVFANDEKSNAYWDSVEKSINDQIGNMDYHFDKNSPNKDVFDGVKALGSFGAGFTPADTYIDTVSFINGKDVTTGEECNRGVLFACIFLPEILDPFVRVGCKQAAKHGDDLAEEAIKKGDDLVSDIVKKVKTESKRLKYMGKTPSKTSRTGKEVIERMKGEGKIRTVRGKQQFMASNGKWYDISEADMAHKVDAVHWWNTVGRKYGAKSKEVRNFMLDSDNYYLEHYSINRSQGAKLDEEYLPPLK